MNLSELGKKIQIAREEKRMTQEQLAEAIGCSQSALSNYEKGKRRIYLSQLEKLSEVLDKPLEYFVEGFGVNTIETQDVPNAPDNDLLRIMNEVFSLSTEERQQVENFIQFLKWKRLKGAHANELFSK